MKDIIPTIFALDNQTFKKKLDILNKFSKTLHIDLCDGKFVKTKTVSLKDCKDIKKYTKNINFQIHLMVQDPLSYIQDIKQLGIQKVFFHFEIKSNSQDLLEIKKKFEKNNLQVGLVINPSTKVDDIIPIISNFKYLMIMSVVPGAEGQEFDYLSLKKVKQLKKIYPKLYIQVDGGIKEEETKFLLENGCDGFCVGSHISSSENPQKNYNNLLSIVNNT